MTPLNPCSMRIDNHLLDQEVDHAVLGLLRASEAVVRAAENLEGARVRLREAKAAQTEVYRAGLKALAAEVAAENAEADPPEDEHPQSCSPDYDTCSRASLQRFWARRDAK